MLAAKGFFNDSGFVPLDATYIPKGRVCIITVLDELIDLTQSAEIKNRMEEKKFLQKIFDDFDTCDEPLPPEFDEIVAERFSIKRELEL